MRNVLFRLLLFFFSFFSPCAYCLTVGLGNTFDFILLLDSVRVGGTPSGIDQFFSKTFSHRLQVTERGLTCTSSKQVQCVVDATEWGHINGLTTDDTGTTHACGIFTWSRVDDSIDDDLDRVLVGQQMDDLQRVLDDTDSHELLARVPSLLHQTARQTFNDGARSLAESLLLVPSGCVWEVNSMVTLAGDVVLLSRNDYSELVQTKSSIGLDVVVGHAVQRKAVVHGNSTEASAPQLEPTDLLHLNRSELLLSVAHPAEK